VNLEQTCEAIFQLHKSNQGVSWTKELGRKYELAYTAKDRLLKEEIILEPQYGDRTKLNPTAHNCDSYEQALSLIKHGNKYTLSVFAFFKQKGFDGEYFWSTISSACDIPSEDSEDTKNVLCYQEYIYKSTLTQEGDLVKAKPENITAALHGIVKKGQPSVHISESLLFDRPTIHKVITTPNKNESYKGINWYSKPLFKYLIWPLLVMILGSLILKYYHII
jgi:hypothetical protein